METHIFDSIQRKLNIISKSEFSQDEIQKAFTPDEINLIEKAKYIRREGTKGNYKYIYDEPLRRAGYEELDDKKRRIAKLDELTVGEKYEVNGKEFEYRGNGEFKYDVMGVETTLPLKLESLLRLKPLDKQSEKKEEKKEEKKDLSKMKVSELEKMTSGHMAMSEYQSWQKAKQVSEKYEKSGITPYNKRGYDAAETDRVNKFRKYKQALINKVSKTKKSIENDIEKGGEGLTGEKKVAWVMKEFKEGKLTSHGEKVTDRDQAIAIAMSEAGLSKK